MTISLEGLNSRHEQRRQRISKPEERYIEFKEQKEKGIKEN